MACKQFKASITVKNKPPSKICCMGLFHKIDHEPTKTHLLPGVRKRLLHYNFKELGTGQDLKGIKLHLNILHHERSIKSFSASTQHFVSALTGFISLIFQDGSRDTIHINHHVLSVELVTVKSYKSYTVSGAKGWFQFLRIL
jgi:hypothetical protein